MNSPLPFSIAVDAVVKIDGTAFRVIKRQEQERVLFEGVPLR